MIYEELDIYNIQLDLENPRIKRHLEIYKGKPTAEQISLALGFGEDKSSPSGPSFSSLKESIRTNGRIIHPIIVNRKEDNIKTVIEGNTRLAIYQEFNRKNTPGKWKYIPAIIHDNLSAEEVDAIRLQAHLVGPRQWDPYSKARFLNELRVVGNMPFEKLVDYCGGRRYEVEQLINAFENMEEYYKPVAGDDFDITRFSGFVELQKKGIKEALSISGYGLKDFAIWVHKRQFDRLEHIRHLPSILKNDEAKNSFLQDGSKVALTFLGGKVSNSGAKLSKASIEDLSNELYKRLETLSLREIKSMHSNPETEKVETIIRLRDVIQDTLEFILKDV